MDDVVHIRNLLAVGDPRVLYLLWLCAASDDESVTPDVVEPPVPGGLAEGGRSFEALLDFFGLDPLILVAASEGAPAPPGSRDPEERIESWVDALSERESKQLLRKLLVEDATTVKAELIAASRDSEARFDWPTVALGHSFNELLERTEVLRAEHETKEQKKQEAAARRKAAKRERERQSRMTEMAKAPKKWLGEAEKLVDVALRSSRALGWPEETQQTRPRRAQPVATGRAAFDYRCSEDEGNARFPCDERPRPLG